jgi:hypothetical protein
MTTLRVSNGDLVPSIGTGILETVTDLEEGAQNVARALLLEYNSFYDEGNEFLNFISGSVTPFMTDSLVQQFITEAINRLIIKQRDIEIESKILQVNQIKTRMVGWTTLVFLVEVLIANGQTLTVVDQARIQPTKLDHILNSGSLITV